MPAHILVIEDNEMSLALADYLLRQGGYSTSRATDGESGVQLALANEAQLILCDLDLPVIDGAQVVKLLRANAAWRAVPVLAFTASSMTDEQRSALTTDFDGCVAKPIDPASFIATIARHLSREFRATHG